MQIGMKVALFYNEAAGTGVALAEIRAALAQSGHQLVRIVERHSDPRRLLDGEVDLIAAAGGDGTVSDAARVIAGHGVPLAVLPIGTANNIALGLGIRGSIDEIVSGWTRAARRPFDLGWVRTPGAESSFLEGVGGGLVPAGIAAHQAQGDAGRAPAGARLPGAIRAYRDALSRLKARRSTVVLDGAPTTDDLLFVEVLNTQAVGPRLELAEADPSDGRLSVVMATEAHRGQIDEYLRVLGESGPGRLSLSAALARNVEVRGWAWIHVDDRLLSVPPGEPTSIRIEPAALEVLSPVGAGV
jgi:diacylglycerol kinase (ATP)